MGRSKVPGIYQGKDDRWHIDKVVRGHRLPQRSFESYEAAEGWVLEQLGKARRPGEVATFDQAAAHYVTKHAEKVSLELDVYLLGLMVPFIGGHRLDRIDDEALEPAIKALRAGKPPATRRLKAKTVNLALDRVRRILNLAARSWREAGKPWLPGLPPLITMLDEDDGRPAMQLAWATQREALQDLPAHLARMALFDLNTGLRDEPLCNLRWKWEVRLEELGFSVFIVPRRYVKGRKGDRVLVCNSVAQSIVESCRGEHPENVFVYTRRKKDGSIAWRSPIGTVNNTGWQKWRARHGLQGFRVQDMRHTVGMRLREAGVSEATRADILWHSREGMPAHYAVAQVLEIHSALELITSERHANNVSLAALIAKARSIPDEVPARRKTA